MHVQEGMDAWHYALQRRYKDVVRQLPATEGMPHFGLDALHTLSSAVYRRPDLYELRYSILIEDFKDFIFISPGVGTDERFGIQNDASK